MLPSKAEAMELCGDLHGAIGALRECGQLYLLGGTPPPERAFAFSKMADLCRRVRMTEEEAPENAGLREQTIW